VNVTERTSEPPRLRVRPRLRELYAYREILLNLVRKELKVKYTASVLGAVWSLLNPVVFLAVFTFVSKVLGGDFVGYPVFLLSGLLGWNLFSVAVNAGAMAVIGNANLVKKVYFPREILPLATVGVALVDLVLQSLVFFAFLVVFRYGFVLANVWLYPLAVVAIIVITVAFTLVVSALNVRYRDVQHLIGLAMLVWFWLTPIVYAPGQVHDTLVRFANGGTWLWDLYLVNPVTWPVIGFQHALYHSDPTKLVPMSTGTLGIALLAVIAIGLMGTYLAWRLYFALSGDFAEEL
jgi:ABC-2 type transport system permease protein